MLTWNESTDPAHPEEPRDEERLEALALADAYGGLPVLVHVPGHFPFGGVLTTGHSASRHWIPVVVVHGRSAGASHAPARVVAHGPGDVLRDRPAGSCKLVPLTSYPEGVDLLTAWRKASGQGEVPMLRTRIPENRKVGGLEYGAHVSRPGWNGYHVRPEGGTRWGIARLTPADDELQPDDSGILAAIEEELAGDEG